MEKFGQSFRYCEVQWVNNDLITEHENFVFLYFMVLKHWKTEKSACQCIIKTHLNGIFESLKCL